MLALMLVVLAQTSPEVPVRRFALLAGANDGGRGRVTLRYATTDAKAVVTVLTQLGGVQPGDLAFVEEPTPAALSAAIDTLAKRLEAARATSARLEMIFYYSGHSDETALLLGEARFPYDELRRRLDALPAEVRVAIVDACASGALTRSKGGVTRAPFLIDASTQLRGHAFLTSASVDEAAQESERLKASVFTHALVSGLRGGADTSRDGRVTLAEAYQFAFNETLARTASTRAGPQRPAFDIQLVGTGEMVLTDVRVASAQLELGSELTGRVFVLSAAGSLVVEVAKTKGAPLQLGVEAGAYRVLVDDGTRLGQAQIALAERQSTTIEPGQLTQVSREALVTRGDSSMPFLPVDVAFVYPLSIGGALANPPRTFFSLGVLTAREGEVNGAAVSSLGTWVDGPTRGLAAAGVAFRSGGLDGVGAAGVVFWSTEAVRGGLFAPVTVATGSLVGLEVGAVNVVGDGLFGAQVGAVNIASGGTSGLQAGAANVATGDFRGLQASTANVALGGFVAGAQIGVVNIGGEVTGAQVGVVNIASTVRGTQVGLLNISKDTTAPIGLLNVMTQGRFRAAAWVSETSLVNVSAKLGSRHVYSQATLGWNPRQGGQLSFGLGLGLHLDFGKFYGQLEADVGTVAPAASLFMANVLQVNERLVVGYQFADAFSVFVGPSFTQLVAFDDADVAGLTPWGFSPSARVRIVPGIVAGVQLF